MIIEVTVVPNSKKFEIVKKDKIKIFLKSKAENNKANLELLKELKKKFKCKVFILSGALSKNKKLFFDTDIEL